MRSWSAYYYDYRIEAIARGRTLRIHELRVDRITVANAKIVSYTYWSTVHATYCFSNVDKEIEIRLATNRMGLSTGFQLFINGEYIGNDKQIDYPTLEEANRKIEKGFWHHFFVNLLKFTSMFFIPPAIVLTIFTLTTNNALAKSYKFSGTPLISYFMISFVILMLTLSETTSFWNETKIKIRNLQRFNLKWR